MNVLTVCWAIRNGIIMQKIVLYKVHLLFLILTVISYIMLHCENVVCWSNKLCVVHSYTFYDPTIMLLIGMWMSLTKNPMKPMMQNPIAVAIAIFWNSRRSGFVHRFTKRIESLANKRPGSQKLIS